MCSWTIWNVVLYGSSIIKHFFCDYRILLFSWTFWGRRSWGNKRIEKERKTEESRQNIEEETSAIILKLMSWNMQGLRYRASPWEIMEIEILTRYSSHMHHNPTLKNPFAQGFTLVERWKEQETYKKSICETTQPMVLFTWRDINRMNNC